MSMDMMSLSGVERIVHDLKALYERYGYTQYKMSKFEEYELYVRNKSFLVSDHIITFTDTDGKLMALKPDVTLSIIKNSRESENDVRKVYYNENVYRVPKGALSFKEIMQAGLECIGDIDAYCSSEVLTLAVKSLMEVSSDYVLDVSHMGIVTTLIDDMGITTDRAKAELLSCIGSKNIHGIDSVCTANGADKAITEKLKKLIAIKGDCAEMLDVLQGTRAYFDALELSEIISATDGNVRIDFSVIDDTSYYSGIVFKGFVKGIPTSVLSGGRYDNLMKRMGKSSSAIGFAVYINLLSELNTDLYEYDTDVLVLYSASTDPKKVSDTVNKIADEKRKVKAVKSIPISLKYRELIDLCREDG